MSLNSVERINSEFSVNGKSYRAEFEARTTLWEVLSEKLGLVGTPRSCNQASCGACTVLVDGDPIYSCHILASDVIGKEIVTIEGLGSKDKPDILQQTGYNNHAAQCGYCTSGWIVAARALLTRNHSPTVEEIKEALGGHLCRCGTYLAIVRSVLEASQLSGTAGKIPQASADHSRVFSMPMERDYSTGGGHFPGDTLIEGDRKIATKKWQGYPPKDLNLVGHAYPAVREISFPKFLGKAEYATRVVLPDSLYAKFLGSPHPHARIRNIDAGEAESLPGVKLILTCMNAPSSNPMSKELMYEGDIVALVVAESEHQAEDAIDAIKVDYETLPHVVSVEQALSPDAVKLRPEGNLLQTQKEDPAYCPGATAKWQHGDVEEGFLNSDLVKEFTYHFRGATIVPLQPVSGVARWEGDKLTFWGMSQGIHNAQGMLAKWLGVAPSDVHYIDRWNGGTFGARMVLHPLDGLVAYAAKVTNRPVKYMLNKREELGQISVKPEVVSKFKVGLNTKEKSIVSIRYETFQIAGNLDVPPGGGGPMNESARDELILYGTNIPNWEFKAYCYKSNTPPVGASRSNTQQEFKWAFECVMDEVAELLNVDPVEFRLKFAARPGQKLAPISDWGKEFTQKPEVEKGSLTFDSYASREVIEEGAKAFGWNRRKKEPGQMTGRFVTGIGMSISDHHGGHLAWKEGEEGYAISQGEEFSSEIELDSGGDVLIRNAMSESGTDHDTGIVQTVGEILGFTSLQNIHVEWGDSDIDLKTGMWLGGRTNTLQGGAALAAAEKLKEDLLKRGAASLGVDVSGLLLKEGFVSTADGAMKISFGELAASAGGHIRHDGHTRTGTGKGRALIRSVGACFVEVEVDILTGAYKIKRLVDTHDSGKVINPLLAESEMDGAFLQGLNATAESLPWDSEAPGRALYSVGFLSYRMPTFMEVPEQVDHIFVDSLEPRWYFGYKSFAETTIGAVPSAITNAIYNAVGIRIREHPISQDRVLSELREAYRQ